MGVDIRAERTNLARNVAVLLVDDSEPSTVVLVHRAEHLRQIGAEVVPQRIELLF
jgi:hypothetical protein